MTTDERELALAQAETLIGVLGALIPRLDPVTNDQEFERACGLYARAVVLRLICKTKTLKD